MPQFRSVQAFVLTAATLGAICPADAQTSSPLIARNVAQRSGLERAWFTQIEMDRGTSRVAFLTQHQGTLFVQTDRATVQAIDAETGHTLWVRQVGRTNHPSMAPAANDKFVAIVNGSVLYVLHRADGRLHWERQLSGGPGAGAALSQDWVFVPMTNGRIEGFRLEDTDAAPWYYTSDGRALVQPLTSAISLSWTTDRGNLYVARVSSPALRFRVESNDAIESPPVYERPNFYVASLDGFVYAVNEQTGYKPWRFSAGSPISQSPAAVEKRVYVCPDRNGMYCIDAESGRELWWTPNVAKFLSVSAEYVYGLDRIGTLYVLDKKNGARLSTLPTYDMTLSLSNVETDRIYLASPFGVVQCLHDASQVTPIVYASPDEEEKEGEPAPPPIIQQQGLDAVAPDAAEPAEPAPNPFGAVNDDPFGN